MSERMCLKGKVIQGEGIGRTLGYPTANLDQRYFSRHPVPEGIYACIVKVKSEKLKVKSKETWLRGIVIVGVQVQKRPHRKKVEVYVLDFNQNIYGKYLEAEIVTKIRKLRTYATPQALTNQIKRDIQRARRILCLPASPKKLAPSKR